MMEWGPEINHGGKRLPGLEDDCPVDGKMIGIDPQWRHTRDGACRADCLTWGAYDAVRLPADHPYYAQQNSYAGEGYDWNSADWRDDACAIDVVGYEPAQSTTPRALTETDAENMWCRVYFDSDLDSHAAFAECLRELGLIREETALDRYFAANPMTVSERDAVTAYAAWAEENA